MSDERTPTVEQFRTLCDLATKFANLHRDRHYPRHVDEEKHLSTIIGLSDAIEAVRSESATFEGWSRNARLAFGRLTEVFAKFIEGWGWDFVTSSEPDRSNFIAARRNAFHNSHELPLLIAALSWSNACEEADIDCPDSIDGLAIQAKAAGLQPLSITAEEARDSYYESDARIYYAPRIGRTVLDFDLDLLKAFGKETGTLNSCLEGLDTSSQNQPEMAPVSSPGRSFVVVAPLPSKCNPPSEQEMVDKLEREGRLLPAKLVSLMIGKTSVDQDDAMDWIWGHDSQTSDENFRQLIRRTNKYMEECYSNIRYKSASAKLHKKVNPE